MPFKNTHLKETDSQISFHEFRHCTFSDVPHQEIHTTTKLLHRWRVCPNDDHDMMPIAPLMKEHVLILRMIDLVSKELSKVTKTNHIRMGFVEVVVDFLRTYADRCHHGKEEDILFRDLAKKQLSLDHQKTMNELIEEHRFARQTVAKLADANRRFLRGDNRESGNIAEELKTLVRFYPKHIEKEDKGFFFPCMDYFDKQEQDGMLTEFREFDRKLIHERYEKIVEYLNTNSHPEDAP